MKRIKKILLTILIVLAILTFIVGGVIAWFIYETDYKVTTLGRYTNPSNNYVVLFESVGEPFLFSPTDVKVVLLNNKDEKVQSISTSIANDGGMVNTDNINVEWFNTYAKVTLSGSEQSDDVSKLYYKED